jgi:hypothetical protein
MEYLSVNEGWGQSYGYVMYRTRLPAHSKQVTIHNLRDYGVVRKKYSSLKISGAERVFEQHSSSFPRGTL